VEASNITLIEENKSTLDSYKLSDIQSRKQVMDYVQHLENEVLSSGK
jgi:hypothetical protein